MDELIINTNIENNNLVSSFSAPKKIEKYFSECINGKLVNVDLGVKELNLIFLKGEYRHVITIPLYVEVKNEDVSC